MGRLAGVYKSVPTPPAGKPEEAANLRVRQEMMHQIEEIIKSEGWTQKEAGRRCGMKQPRMSDLVQRRVARFSLDALVNIATALGRRVRVELDAADQDAVAYTSHADTAGGGRDGAEG